MDNTQERELGWEDDITQDGQEYIDIPDGDYDFVIEKVERSRYNGGDKVPACNLAIITIGFLLNGQRVSMTERLMLYSKFEWKLSQFFASIGLKQKDQPLKMSWNITGYKGRCKVGHKQYDGKTYNEIKKFYPVWELEKQPQQQNYNYQPNNGGYTAGKF